MIGHQHLRYQLQELLIFPDYIRKIIIVVSLNKCTSSKSRSILRAIIYYEKNCNTIQLLPENVDGFRHLTKNISAISIAIRISWVGHTREINYIVSLNISFFTLTRSAVRSLTDTAHIIVSLQSPLSAAWCVKSSHNSVLTASEFF